MISRNITPISTLVCLRTKSNIFKTHKKAKGEQLFALAWVVGADGFEPPTYAL